MAWKLFSPRKEEDCLYWTLLNIYNKIPYGESKKGFTKVKAIFFLTKGKVKAIFFLTFLTEGKEKIKRK